MLMPLQVATPPPAAVRPPPAPPLIRIEAVAKRFGATAVLEGIDLEIGDGEFVALLGPSGCGKTTLLRILCGIETASSGRVLLGGEDITRWSPAARGFGIVFQSYALFPNLTATQNVAYGLAGMSREHRSRRAREMLDLVGLAAQAQHYPAQLSGGQQQRWPARWLPTHACCCWTSPCRLSMRRCGLICGPRSAPSAPDLVSAP
jgi:ABC-type Fe3+/spermidine/putrescine transport system ATPase subunit